MGHTYSHPVVYWPIPTPQVLENYRDILGDFFLVSQVIGDPPWLMVGLQWTIPGKKFWMIWGYPHFRKLPYIIIYLPKKCNFLTHWDIFYVLDCTWTCEQWRCLHTFMICPAMYSTATFMYNYVFLYFCMILYVHCTRDKCTAYSHSHLPSVLIGSTVTPFQQSTETRTWCLRHTECESIGQTNEFDARVWLLKAAVKTAIVTSTRDGRAAQKTIEKTWVQHPGKDRK